MLWNTALAQEWIAGPCESELIFYIDGQVRVDSGDLTPLSRQDVARERLGLPGTTDSSTPWTDRRSSWSIKKSIPGCWPRCAAILVPWLETNAPVSAELQPRLPDDQPRCTWVLDRAGYRPEFFS
jgi:hypothetical protein